MFQDYSEARSRRRKQGTRKTGADQSQGLLGLCKDFFSPCLSVGIKTRTLNHIKNTGYMESYAQREPCKKKFFFFS